MEYINPVKNYEEFNGCISNTQPSQYFSADFLNSEIFKLLPEGYDICYNLIVFPETTHMHLYLYDSTVPLREVSMDHVAGSIYLFFDTPYKWSYNWMPFYRNMMHIPELMTNDDLQGFNAMGGGIGTFMILCAMAYSKSMNIHYVTLYDASKGYRTPNNIYKLIGFDYVNDGHDMTGNVNEIYSKISHFVKDKGDKLKNKISQLDTYFDNPEEDPDWLPGDLSVGGSNKKTRKSRRKKTRKKRTRKRTRKNKRSKPKKKSNNYLTYEGLNGKEKSWYLYVMKNN